MRVCIVGAGAGGLASIRYCTTPDSIFTCVAYEQTDSIGGTWVYNEQSGTDEDGLPIHTSMYQDLITNLPKESMEFIGFPFPTSKQSFIRHEQVLEYLESYTDHYDLRKHIKFHHKVTCVSPLPNHRWVVEAQDLKTQEWTVGEFDAVLVCNGHYSEPFIPEVEGGKVFKGTQIHSRFYRLASTYRSKNVLVVGAGPSAIDIAKQLSQEAKQVFVSCIEATPVLQNLDVTIKQGGLKLTELGAEFEDGSLQEFDSIIYATGYLYSYPFLSKSCSIRVEDNHVQPLYKHFINTEHTSMGIIGIPYGVIPFPLFDLQVQTFLNALSGKIQLPSKEEMVKDAEDDFALRRKGGFREKDAHKIGKLFIGEYYNGIARVGGIPPFSADKIKLYETTKCIGI